jgi:hypothetical protein
MLFSHIYDTMDGLSPSFHRLIRAMITEILYAHDTRFNYIAVDLFGKNMRSTPYFGDFTLTAGRNRSLPDAASLAAYLQCAQSYFDTPTAVSTDRYTSINVDIPDALIVDGCNHKDSPYFPYVASATTKSPPQVVPITTAAAHPPVPTVMTLIPVTTITPSPTPAASSNTDISQSPFPTMPPNMTDNHHNDQHSDVEDPIPTQRIFQSEHFSSLPFKRFPLLLGEALHMAPAWRSTTFVMAYTVSINLFERTGNNTPVTLHLHFDRSICILQSRLPPPTRYQTSRFIPHPRSSKFHQTHPRPSFNLHH